VVTGNMAPEAPKEPELVGTLLGDRPSAVFRGAKQLAVVPVGGRFGDWKVQAVRHGEAIVKSGTRTVRLDVNGGSASGIAVRWEEAPAAPKGSSRQRRQVVEADQGAPPAKGETQVTNHVIVSVPELPSEPNSITRELTEGVVTDTANSPGAQPAPGNPTGPAPSGPVPSNPAPPAPENPVAPPPDSPKGTTPPADPPANTERVIKQEPPERPRPPVKP
jgi:hypothetical protein